MGWGCLFMKVVWGVVVRPRWRPRLAAFGAQWAVAPRRGWRTGVAECGGDVGAGSRGDIGYARRYGALVSMPTDAAGRGLSDVVTSDAALRRYLHGLPGVDAVGLEARAAGLGTRSIKTTAKAYALDLAISMIDLTTLEGSDTPGKVRALCAKGARPDPGDRSAPVSRPSVCTPTWRPPPSRRWPTRVRARSTWRPSPPRSPPGVLPCP